MARISIKGIRWNVSANGTLRAMPRYHFKVTGAPFLTTEDDLDLANDDSAWTEARMLLRDVQDNLRPGEAWELDVERDGSAIFQITVMSKRS